MTSLDVTFELGRSPRAPRSIWDKRRLPKRSQKWFVVVGVALAVYLIVLPFVNETTQMRENSQIIIAVLAVLGINIATGYGGMISLGHGVFVGVGAFATAYYADDWSLPWVVAILLATITTGLVGALVGLPALRIQGIHLALVTLCLAIAFQPIAKRFPFITGGVTGRAVNATFDAPGWWPGSGGRSDATYRYVFCLLVIGIAILLVWNLINSRAGRAMRALRDNPTAAAIYGINLVRTRVATFAVSAALAGITGGLGVVLVPFVSQATFTPQESLTLYATAVIGGLGLIWGSVLGVIVRELLGWVGSLLDRIDNWGALSEVFDLLGQQALVFGFGLIVLTFVFPRGLVGLLSRQEDLVKKEAGD